MNTTDELNEDVTIAVVIAIFKAIREVVRKKRFSGLQRDSMPWPLRSRCSALPAELSRPIHQGAGQLLSSSTRERNETQPE